MASGRFLYPANDVLGDAQPQKFYTLADSVHVAWESYVTNTLDRRLYLAYYLLDLSKPWQYVAAYSQSLIPSGSITLELDLGLGGPYLGKYIVYDRLQSGNWVNFTSALFEVDAVDTTSKPITWNLSPTSSSASSIPSSSASSATSSSTSSTTSAVPSSITSASTQAPATSMASSGTLLSAFSSTPSGGAFAGIFVGVLAFVAAALIAAIFLYRRWSRRGKKRIGRGNIGRSLSDLRLPHEFGLMELPADQHYEPYQSGSSGYAWDINVGDQKLLVSTEENPVELPAEHHIQMEGDGHRWEMDAGGSKKL